MDAVKEAQQQKADQIYNSLTLEEKQNLYSLLNTPEYKEKKESIEKLIYKNGKRPPTPEEFVTIPEEDGGWLPKKVLDSTFPFVKQEIIDVLDPFKNYFRSVDYGAQRLGKTYKMRLIIIYYIIYFHHLRDPGMFMGLSSLTELCIYLISFKFDKTRQLYLKPIFKILGMSKRFIQVTKQDQVEQKQAQVGIEKIVFSKASTSGEITLASGLQIHLGNNDQLAYIGGDIIMAIVSEINWFIIYAGASEEQIFELYTNLVDRIDGTVGKDKYLALSFLDSSANIRDSKIEKYVIEELSKDPETYFNWRSRWESRPYLFPKWYKKKQELEKENLSENELQKELYKQGFLFRVITGNGQHKAKFEPTEKEVKEVPKDLVIFVPIDARKAFKDNLVTSIKNIAGIPTSNENKFIQDQKLITNIFSNKSLKSNNRALIIGSELNPERLIWEKVEHLYWNKTPHGQPIIYRAPTEPRFVAIDHAHSKNGDMASISCCHPEFSEKNNCVMAIFDFLLTIKPSQEGINLSAITCFILDLLRIGNLNIKEVASDTFESATMHQDLKRMEVETIKRSVDRTIIPYMRTLSAMNTGTVKAGYSLFLENNLSCLEMQKKGKDGTGADWVNHPTGSDTGEGKFGKDTSDSFANSTYGLFSSEYIPATIYEDENKRLSVDENDIKETIEKTITDMITVRVKTNTTRIENNIH